MADHHDPPSPEGDTEAVEPSRRDGDVGSPPHRVSDDGGSRAGSLGAHSVVYLVGTALQGLGVLLVLPFATRVLGAAEFGRVATGLVIVQMVGTIAAAGVALADLPRPDQTARPDLGNRRQGRAL